MATHLAALESLLRDRKLGDTLVSARPVPREQLAPTDIGTLDDQLGGGLTRGHLSEIVGPRSSGRTSLLCAMLAAATRRGEVVTLIDAFDTFDPMSGDEAGIDLSRLLWIRGRQQQGGHDRRGDQVDRAIRAAGLVFQAGRFGVVAVDLVGAPRPSIRRLPFTTWRRLAQSIEGSDTVGIVMGDETLGRSARGRSIVLGTSRDAARWSGTVSPNRMFRGVVIDARVESTRHPDRPVRVVTETAFGSRRLETEGLDPR